MPLIVGDSDCTFGLAKRIHDNLLFGCPSALDNVDFKSMCHGIASAVVAELTANATVLPALLVAPPGGGPVTGTGVVT
jgi:hypothetical protein